MEKRFVFNYAVVKFLPYPETEEFVNIGVALCCPELGIFDFKIESRRRDRISGFFPELEIDVYANGRRELVNELGRIKATLSTHSPAGQTLLKFKETDYLNIFKEITKPRENIFCFGDIRTKSSFNPEQEVDVLFEYYVSRQFAIHEDYQEKVMTDRLRKQFKASNVMQYYKSMPIGDDVYKVRLPFVHRISRTNGKHYKAIKPLYFDKKDTTQILEYGDRWRFRLEQLKKIDALPEQMLFVVRPPEEKKKNDAYHEVYEKYIKMNISVLSETETDKILEYAHAI